jgi:hypothetical protein
MFFPMIPLGFSPPHSSRLFFPNNLLHFLASDYPSGLFHDNLLNISGRISGREERGAQTSVKISMLRHFLSAVQLLYALQS